MEAMDLDGYIIFITEEYGVLQLYDIGKVRAAYVVVVEDQVRPELCKLAELHNIQPIDVSGLIESDSTNPVKEPVPGEENSGIHQHSGVHLSQVYCRKQGGIIQAAGIPSHTQAIDTEDFTGSKKKVTSEYTNCESKQIDSACCLNTQTDFKNSEVATDFISREAGHKFTADGLKAENKSTDVLGTKLKCLHESSKVEDTMEMTVLNNFQANQANGPHPTGYDNSVMGGFGDSSQENVTYDSMESGEEVDPPESKPHREMAIDVPANFVGQKKEPPRYPSHIQGGGYQSANSSQPSTPSKVNSAKRTSYKPSNTPPLQQPPKMSKEEELESIAKIQKYQEDLRKRKEQEESFQREQDFLRNSLRDSQKLKELQENGPKASPNPGYVNPNYMIEEEESIAGDNVSKSSTLPVRQRAESALYKKPLNAEQIANTLQKIQGRLQNVSDVKSLQSIQAFFEDPRFLQTLFIHNKIVELTLKNQIQSPAHTNSQGLVTEVLEHLPPNTGAIFVEELRRLLQKTHFKNLMSAHDGVAQSKQPKRQRAAGKASKEESERDILYERASQYGEESIKIVRLQKTADPLGATVRNEGESVVIGRIVKGGAAEKSGLLHEGDEILEINGTDVRNHSIDDVCDLMASLTGTLTFLIVPSQEFTASSPSDKLIHYKAHFDYDPEDDPYIPCRELGIMFRKSDILHVINQSDSCWWQAYREGEDDQNLAGLIPSRSFQEQKEALMLTMAGDSKDNKNKNKCSCQRRPNKSKKKKKKNMYNASGEEGEEEILTYEEVAQYYPQPNRKRPIVMIGPSNVGRQELRQRLMESDLDRFAAAIPHTSRQRKDTEQDGQDYHFVSRLTFEADIAGHKFVEYGEYEKNLYGTSLESIRTVVNTGKTCVLNLHPQSLRILKASDLKPYVVFIAPPNIEKLRQLRLKQDNARVSDVELQEIIEKAREMEENFGQYFDFIIMNYDTGRAYDDLLKEINRLEVEPQWVPAQWLT